MKPKKKKYIRPPQYRRKVTDRTFNNRYRAWRTDVLRRDKFTCQICGKKGKDIKMVVHHLDGWHWCVDRRYDVTNGVTLCDGDYGCHSMFHRMYGVGNNTEQQFLAFKQIVQTDMLQIIIRIFKELDKYVAKVQSSN